MSNTKPRVLIVEDELIVARNLQERLQRLGYEVSDVASTGEDAVDRAGRQKPDIVLMDIKLQGDIDGIEAAERINAEYNIPVVYLTAYADDSTLVRAKNTNPYGYLLKPIESRELRSTIEMTLMKHSFETKMRNREQWLSTILRGVGEAVIVFNTAGKITYFNPAAERLLDVPQHLAIGRPISDVFTLHTNEADADGTPLEISDIAPLETKVLEDVILRTKDDMRIDVDSTLSRIVDDGGNAAGTVVVLRDITERRKAAAEKERQLKFESIITAISSRYVCVTAGEMHREIVKTLEEIGSFLSVDRVYILIADYLENILELRYEWCASGIVSRRDISSRVLLKDYKWVLQQTDKPEIVRIPKKADLPDEAAFLNSELHKAGVKTFVSLPIKYGDRLLGILCLDSVKERKRWKQNSIRLLQIVSDLIGAAIIRRNMEKDLRENREKFENITELAPETIFETDDKGYITFINRRGFEYFGYSEEEFYNGFSAVNLVAPQERSHMDQSLSRILKGEQMGTREFLALRKDGSTFPAHFHSRAIIRNQKVVGIGGIVIDISEQKKQEQELLKTQKLESIGVLAGGIAHDFNNILTAILGNISLATMEVDPSSELYAILSDAERASVRARDLTQQLLTFSEGGSPVKKTSSISHIIRDSAEFCLRGSNVRCEFSLPDNLHRVQIDQSQMSQVINNLIINADQAMPTGGKIQVAAENTEITAATTLPLNPGAYIKITITDHGTGIPKAELPRIFDPFFTTKENCNGLGLAIAYSIVKKHNGAIDVQSQPAVGSTFSIYLPTTDDETETSAERAILQTAGAGRILIMDDVMAVRKLAGRVLERLGYDVEYASDGEEAIRLYSDARNTNWAFDAVIMDLTIPGGMGGLEALKRIKEIDPAVKAIVSSGYSNDPVMASYESYGFKACVIKPYRPNQLASVVNSVVTGQ
ncbi:MAG: response regulator [Candidatus Zixiibacteriota bacterium]